jgi:hypothetical protein
MSDARATLSGDLQVGEASAAARDLRYRVHGSMFGLYLALAALLAVCVVGGYFLVDLIAPGEDWGALLGAIVALVTYRFFWRKALVSRFRKRFTAQGLPLELPLRIEIGPEALVNEVGGVKRIVQWPVVTELFNSHGYWIFVAQADAIFTPARLFASEQEQRDFIAAAVSHMSEAAKSRSARAVAFAAGRA